MHLAWVAAAVGQTKVNKPGLVFAAVFVVVALILVLRASQANRRRASRATEYVREEHVGGASATPLPAHTWQAIENPDVSSLFGPPIFAHAPAFARFVARLADPSKTVENVRSTPLANTTLVVFDHLQEQTEGNGTRIERTVCAQFGLDLNCPWLEIMANVGLGTVGFGGSRVQSFKFEYDDFNQAFTVLGGDQKFAFSLFDGEMMRWFLAHPQLQGLHLRGTNALGVFTPADPATDSDAVLAFVSGLLSRIPPLVHEEWPGS